MTTFSVNVNDIPLTVSEELEKLFKQANEGTLKFTVDRIIPYSNQIVKVVPGYISNSLYDIGKKYFSDVKIYGHEGQRGWAIKRVGNYIIKYMYSLKPLEVVVQAREVMKDPANDPEWDKYYDTVVECLKRKGLWNEFVARIPPKSIETLVKDVYNAYKRENIDPQSLDWCTAFSDIASDVNILNLNQAKEILEKEFHVPFPHEIEPQQCELPSLDQCISLLEEMGYAVESSEEVAKYVKQKGYIPKVKIINEDEIRKMGIRVDSVTYVDDEAEINYIKNQAESIGKRAVEGVAELVPGKTTIGVYQFSTELKLAVIGKVPIASNVPVLIIENAAEVNIMFINKPLGELKWE